MLPSVSLEVKKGEFKTPIEQKRTLLRARHVFRTLVFFAFLATFTALTVLQSSWEFQPLKEFISSRLEGKMSGLSLALSSVSSKDDLWDFLTISFQSSILSNITAGSDFFNGDPPSKILPPFDDKQYNKVVGGIRVRQLRVVPNLDCSLPSSLSALLPCYSAYTSSAESSNTFLEIPFSKKAASGNTNGIVASYPSSGYSISLRPEVASGFSELFISNFVDRGTRAILLEINLWNSNFQVYPSVRVLFEQTVADSWMGSFEIEFLRKRDINPFGFETNEDIIYVGVLIGLILLVSYYVFEEITEIALSRSAYLKDAWNFLDWLNLILLMTHFGMIIQLVSNGFTLKNVLVESSLPSDTFIYPSVDLWSFIVIKQRLATIIYINAFLLCVKILKFFPTLPFLEVLTFGLVSAAKNLLVLTVCVIVGSLLLSAAFINKVTISRFFELLGYSVIGGYDFRLLIENGGHWLFIFFVIFLFFFAISIVALVASSVASCDQVIRDQRGENSEKFFSQLNQLRNIVHKWFPGLSSSKHDNEVVTNESSVRPLSIATTGGSEDKAEERIDLGPLQPDKLQARRRHLASLGSSLVITSSEIVESSQSMTKQVGTRIKRVGREMASELQKAKTDLESVSEVVKVLRQRVADLHTQRLGDRST